ncbi:hypothetical protein M3Y97_00474100 [Aphelenchoides bicaudatus]|nr:hypothetical protein M3Y97_00474100 [Aphelenchoides bicaudatus]
MSDFRSNNSDDETDEGMFSEFESACTSVSQLFRNHCWRNFQNAAVNTTQLYRVGLEAKKRAFEKGYQSGRLQLAKEILNLKRYNNNKIDVQDLVSVLTKYSLVPNDHRINMASRQRTANNQSENTQDVNLFQQALNPSNLSNSNAQRAPGLNSFLQHQLHRHRKRAHSPMDTRSPNGSPNYNSNHALFKRKRL